MAGVAIGLFRGVTSRALDKLLRPARPGDEPALAAIDELVNPSHWTAGQFASACDGSGLERALLVQYGQHIAGFVVYSCVIDESCIDNLAVHPAKQRAGLGRMLLGAALEAARGLGASRCCLEVRASNRAALGLYEAFGFQQDGLRKNYYGGAGQPGAGQPGAGQPGAGQPGAGQPEAGVSGAGSVPATSREDAILLSIQL